MAKPPRADFLARLRFLRSRRCHAGLRGCEVFFLTWARIEPDNSDDPPPFLVDKEARESQIKMDDTIVCRWTGKTTERICLGKCSPEQNPMMMMMMMMMMMVVVVVVVVVREKHKALSDTPVRSNSVMQGENTTVAATVQTTATTSSDSIRRGLADKDLA